jgi:peptidyl-prolyl cis-trans isomerase D
MLDLMRRHAKSWVINVMIAAIAIVFIFWGAGSFRQREVTHVAKVNGETISLAEYDQTYRQLVEQAQNQFRDYLDDEMLEALNLRQQALDRLIDQRLIYQQAQKMGLDVLDREIQREIAATPMFQVDGRFDPQRYRTMLGRFGYSPSEYEQLLRLEKIAQNVVELVGGLASASNEEALDYFHFANDRVNLDYILFPADDFEDQVDITDQAMREYYENHKSEYRVPERAKVAYMAFRPADLEGEVKVSQDEIADHYEFNLDQYRRPEQVQASHILLRVPAEAGPEAEAEVQRRAETILERVRKPDADFAEVAAEVSDGPSAAEGGDLGWFSRDEMVEPFAEAAFEAEKGEVVGPVKTQFGYHIIKVRDRRPAGSAPLEEVAGEIEETIRRDKAAMLAVDRAEDVYDEVSLSQDFDQVAEDWGLAVNTTEPFSQNEALPEFGMDAKINEMALSLTEGDIGPLMELENGYYIFKVQEKKDSYIPEFEEVEAEVRVDLSRQMAMARAKEAAADFIQSAQEKSWDEAAAEVDRESRTTGSFTRGEPVPDIGSAPQLTETAFALEPGQVAETPYGADQGFYAYRLDGFNPASPVEFKDQKKQIMDMIERQKAQLYVAGWLDEVRQKADITVEQKLFN